MWTSTSREGSNSAFSRSPCFTLFPPPPKKWQVPQFVRCGLPDVLRDARQIDGRVGHARAAGRFDVGAAVVVAGEAVDVAAGP